MALSQLSRGISLAVARQYSNRWGTATESGVIHAWGVTSSDTDVLNLYCSACSAGDSEDDAPFGKVS